VVSVGSDFRYYEGENPLVHNIPWGIYRENPPNMVLGHEFAGEVVAVLKEETASGWEKGSCQSAQRCVWIM